MTKKKLTVQYKVGYRPPAGVTVQGAASVLGKLLAGGDLTTERVLEAAQPEASPIHNVCEWDDGVAAHEHRLRQCRVFLRGVTIIVDAGDPQPLIHVPSISSAAGRAGTYVLSDVLASRPDEMALAMAEAHRALQSARARVEEVELMIPTGDQRLDAIRLAFQGFDAVQGALRILEKV
jgi:hypothetical protein